MSKVIRNKNNDEFYILNLAMTGAMKNKIVLDSIENKKSITTTLRFIIKKFITEQKKQNANNTNL
jgi:hypothetical protein